MDAFVYPTAVRLLSTAETARLLQLAPGKLEELRADGGGPLYQQIEERVLYALDDVVAWAKASATASSTPPKQAPTLDTQNPPRYLTTPEAAQLVCLSPRTLEKHRLFGTGPNYRKIGGRVIYASTDVLEWAESGAKASTSDGNQGAAPARTQG